MVLQPLPPRHLGPHPGGADLAAQAAPSLLPPEPLPLRRGPAPPARGARVLGPGVEELRLPGPRSHRLGNGTIYVGFRRGEESAHWCGRLNRVWCGCPELVRKRCFSEPGVLSARGAPYRPIWR